MSKADRAKAAELKATVATPVVGGVTMENGKMSAEIFTRRAILQLRGVNEATGEAWKGMHTVFSGFNAAWRAYFGNDPVVGIKLLASAGKIVSVPAFKGVRLYLPEDAPKTRMTAEQKGADALAKILA